MDDGIQFGEIERDAPGKALRPDENRHYAVLAYGQPQTTDLAIYVDLDVLREMEDHAHSDTSVELGGVLLGGQHEDAEGRPFVVITDCLRAQHYEATRGSFKFTHDTWSAITRERQGFGPELSMVGWYHTHPGWSVFLSGMDLFICDHFFNRPLDVAYVIDPCRGDRGMFQWTGQSHERIKQTRGFFVTAARFRAAELENYLAELSGNMTASLSNRGAGGSSAAPVIHLHQPQGQQPAWQAIAVAGGLFLQFALVALIALKSLSPAAPVAPSDDDKLAAAIEKLDGSLDSRRRLDQAQERTRSQGELLDQVVRELKATDEGFVTRLQERFDQSEKLAADVAARDAQVRELRTLIDDHRSRLQALETSSRQEESRLKHQIATLTTENDKLRVDLKKSKDEVTTLLAKANAQGAPALPEKDVAKAADPVWWWAGGAALIAALVIGAVWWINGAKGLATLAAPDEKAADASV